MITTRAMETAARNDAELVAASLNGNRDAFGQIVARYQSLICSLAYSAVGSLGQSEDLAQETFITAWKHLGHLRERHKLRSWLCGIARNRINNTLRRDGREPVHGAEPLETAHESPSLEPLPPDQAIGREEQAILWRSLEKIPEIYREPLFLFYREGESVERVAAALELSEDAVKQRLSRGRKLLHEQVLALVEGTLRQTIPGKAFTLGVIAALPLLGATATATAAGATVGATAAEGGAMAKATGLGVFFQGILKAASGFLAVLSPVVLLGGYFGFKMSCDARRSSHQRELVARFWRGVVVSLAAFILLPVVLLVLLSAVLPRDMRPQILTGLTWWLGLLYVVLPVAVALWLWRRRGKAQPQETAGTERAGTRKRPFTIWVVLATIGAGILFVAGLFDTNWKVGRLTTTEAQKIIAEQKDAKFSVHQLQNGRKYLWVRLQENGKVAKFTAPAEESTLALLAQKGIACPTYVQGRDFEILGWPGRLLPLLCIFIFVAGVVVLLTKFRRRGSDQQEMDLQQVERIQHAERNVNRAIAACAALAMIGMSILLVLYTIAHAAPTVSGAEAKRIILEHKNARFHVFQFSNGEKILRITLQGSGRYPSFEALADETTLTLLAENGLPYKTLVQGRDFGYRSLSHWLSLSCSFILAAGAVLLLRWAVKKEKRFPTPAQTSA